MVREGIIQLVDQTYPLEHPANTAFFLDGSGSCCAAVLDYHVALGKLSPITPVIIVTSGMEGNQAEKRTEEFIKKGVELDNHFDANIERFYRKLGSKIKGKDQGFVTLRTEKGINIREQWTDRMLMPEMEFDGINLGVFGGFNPLTNMVGHIPCLNTHPGALDYLKDGKRYLVGWQEEPVERAILEGLDHLRTTVILAMPYDKKNPLGDMDNGVITGMSPKVLIDLYGHKLSELKKIAEARPKIRPKEGFGDVLEKIASKNQNNLKEGGDWVVFPPTVMDAARGYLAVTRFPDPNAGLLYLKDPTDIKSARPIQHIIYHKTGENRFEREIIEKTA